MMVCLRIASFHCGGLADHRRRKAIFDHLRTLNIHLYLLQETHHRAQEKDQWSTDWGRAGAIFHFNIKNRNNGVAILINHPELSISRWSGDHDGRIIAVDLAFHSNIIHVVNIHAPQCNYSIQDRTHFFNSLYTYTYSSFPTVLAGPRLHCFPNRPSPALYLNPSKPSQETQKKTSKKNPTKEYFWKQQSTTVLETMLCTFPPSLTRGRRPSAASGNSLKAKVCCFITFLIFNKPVHSQKSLCILLEHRRTDSTRHSAH